MDDQAPGSRKGSRKAARPPRSLDRRAVALAAGTVAAAAAWAGLVYAGIRFGQSARAGDGAGWLFMVIAALGAVACLFLALMLGIRLARVAGAGVAGTRSDAPRGGRRVAGRRSVPRS